MGKLLLYHGSSQAVPQPDIGHCRPNNDYGRGFYCTDDRNMALEWACQTGHDGFASCYELKTEGLNILDLNGSDYTTLHWLEVLLANRLMRLSTPVMQRGARWLQENFSVDLTHADIVHGYRADDSYFGFARAFLRNEITLNQLQQAMKLGNLGTQYMMKSPRVFERLRYIGCEAASASIYWPRQTEREDAARWAFSETVRLSADIQATSDTDYKCNRYINDLMTLDKETLHASLQ